MSDHNDDWLDDVPTVGQLKDELTVAKSERDDALADLAEAREMLRDADRVLDEGRRGMVSKAMFETDAVNMQERIAALLQKAGQP